MEGGVNIVQLYFRSGFQGSHRAYKVRQYRVLKHSNKQEIQN